MSLVFYASYWSGVRVVDYSDVEHPQEIAYYNAARNPALESVTESDHSDPPIPYDEANCFLYTGWTDNGLIILELKDPKYNPCLRKAATGSGTIAGGRHVDFSFNAKRADDGFGALTGDLQLNDNGSGTSIHLSRVTSLGSVRNQCGTVQTGAASLEFAGDGVLNGKVASFRVCVQDNGEGGRKAPDQFFLTCTAGCSYTAGGAVESGNIREQQQ